MGKFSIPIPREYPKIDYSNVINDIHNQLSIGKKVLIIYETQSSRQAATSLLKKLPLNDVYKVMLMDKGNFENQKARYPDIEYYQISAEGVLDYLANISDASS